MLINDIENRMTRYWASILLRHRSLCPFAANDAYIRMHMWLDVCQEIVPRPINCDIQAVKYGSISINIRGWPPQWERFAQSPWVGGRLSLCIVCVCMCVSDMWQLCWQSNYSIYLRNCIEYFFFVCFVLFGIILGWFLHLNVYVISFRPKKQEG